MAQLVIFTSPKDPRMSPAEWGQLHVPPYIKVLRKRNNKGPLTPRQKERGSRRVINLHCYDPEIDYSKLAQDLCHDAGDKYYGHEVN